MMDGFMHLASPYLWLLEIMKKTDDKDSEHDNKSQRRSIICSVPSSDRSLRHEEHHSSENSSLIFDLSLPHPTCHCSPWAEAWEKWWRRREDSREEPEVKNIWTCYIRSDRKPVKFVPLARFQSATNLPWGVCMYSTLPEMKSQRWILPSGNGLWIMKVKNWKEVKKWVEMVTPRTVWTSWMM